MTAPLRKRGACPSLAAPMLTGDGWLVRFSPKAALSAEQLGALAFAAARYGNGHIEITARGSLQIRGLTTQATAPLAAVIAEHGIAIRSGFPVEIGPLAGLDVAEIADPRPLATAIGEKAAIIAKRLGPKVSVTVDGGGALSLGEMIADVKLDAVRYDSEVRWVVRIDGRERVRLLGTGDAQRAVASTIAVLDCVARKGPEARARDIDDADLRSFATGLRPINAPIARPCAHPIGTFPLCNGDIARGYGLAFGQTTSGALVDFATAAAGHDIRLAPNRGFLVFGLTAEAETRLTIEASRLGFVTALRDPRSAIVACAGAPACAAAHLPTKLLAQEIVAARHDVLDGSFRLHVSGCAKRCAQPSGPHMTLVAHAAACEIFAQDVAPSNDLRDLLLQKGRAHLVVAPGHNS